MKKSELLNLIEDAKTIGIFGHIRPDGDCVGSCLGLYNYIQDNYDAEVTVYLEKIPDKFSFLKGADAICHEPESRVLDLAISLDCGDRDRHGSFYELFGMAKKSACLDHHRSNQGFGDYYYCDADASSASEVLFRHIDPENISLACAECLYLGIVHDTGVFKYSACTKDTMQVAGELLAHGVDAQKIIDDTLQSQLQAESAYGTGDGQCKAGTVRTGCLHFCDKGDVRYLWLRKRRDRWHCGSYPRD